ncbi:GNAT family N-acetyltransferase [Faecalibacter macacae]|uniref:GNAT family N-acetyltransferase n=1 Tax=Faecalibacter macacae TaxID=1859289 RepID=A0A3L9MJX5_9FLAO|nr:GNAT family N-acetyltransferase [Faecalibacter macacae]RLZ11604.1 GNAT family N-acetyltransferase [Faecalibacter macacae]
MEIRLTLLEEKNIVKELFIKEWNSDIMISKNQKHFVENLESIIAVVDKEIIGLLTFNIINKQAEIVSLDSFNEGKGIGTKLLDFTLNYFKNLYLDRIWLITSNDNCHAIRFYQKRGWKMVNIHFNAIEEARLLKPQIPMFGYDGIPILHEIEFEYSL